MNTDTQLNQLLEWLELERKEDLRQYRQMVQRRTLKERVQKGVSWYPVTIKTVSIGTGEKIVLELEHGAKVSGNQAMQTGSVVAVFGMAYEEELGRKTGVISYLRRDVMRVVLTTEQIPDWLYGTKLGIDLEFDDSTYREMEKAVNTVREAKKHSRLAELRDVLIGGNTPSFHQWEIHYQNPDLNPSQNEAVQKCLESLDVAVIHGPPGTGKTTTLVQVIKETLRREHQVLVCAASNTAVDLLVLKCLEQGLEVVRLGNPARVEEALQLHTLDGAITQHDDYKMLRKIRKDAEGIRKQALKYKRHFGGEERQKRKRLMKEARDLKDAAYKLEDYILHQILNGTQVVAATLSGAASSLLGSKRFHTVFIDEAAQALEPSCWIPILRSGRVIFAGDHFQLPPTVKSLEAAKGGLSRTLMEKVIDSRPEVAVMLDTQYRMNEAIMGFSGQRFYEGNLKAHKKVKHHRIGPNFEPVIFIDTAGCGFEERKNPETLSTCNPEEANLLLKHLALLFNQIEAEVPSVLEQAFSVGIIAPYKEQVKKLKDQLLDSPLLSSYVEYISVNTVDGFQGQEREVIYISLTRSNSKGEIGFLKDVRRMNVALTRARKQLVVVGDSATLGEHPFYAAMLSYMEQIGAYRTAWEWIHV